MAAHVDNTRRRFLRGISASPLLATASCAPGFAFATPAPTPFGTEWQRGLEALCSADHDTLCRRFADKEGWEALHGLLESLHGAKREGLKVMLLADGAIERLVPVWAALNPQGAA